MTDFWCEGDTLLDPGPCKAQCRMCQHEVETALVESTLVPWREPQFVEEIDYAW